MNSCSFGIIAARNNQRFYNERNTIQFFENLSQVIKKKIFLHNNHHLQLLE